MIVGYARVSKPDQLRTLQLDALQGCDHLFFEVASGSKTERIELNRAIASLRPGDTLKVWRLDRLGRSLSHLIEIITYLGHQKINLQSVSENIDTSTATGQMVFDVFDAIAECERGLIRERTIAGLDAARSRGRHGGRKRILRSEDIKAATQLQESGMNVGLLCQTLNISRSTYYRHIYRQRIDC